jgi:hypothetical protein
MLLLLLLWFDNQSDKEDHKNSFDLELADFER